MNYDDNRDDSAQKRSSDNPSGTDVNTASGNAYYELFRENTTLHGVPDTLKSFGWLRKVWIIIVTLAVAAALVGCTFIVIEYNDRPLSVTYTMQRTASAELPDIIICPFNRFNASFFTSLNISSDLIRYIERTFGKFSMSTHIEDFEDYEGYTKIFTFDPETRDRLEAELLHLLHSMGNISLDEFFKKAFIRCDAFLRSGTAFDEPEELCEEYVRPVITKFGQCFRVTGSPQAVEGPYYAQRLIVYLPKHLYYYGMFTEMNDGISVMLVEKGRGLNIDFSLIPTRVHSSFRIKATRFEFMNYPPHHNCRPDVDAIYSPSLCFHGDPQPMFAKKCTASEITKCYLRVFNQISFSQELISRCQQRCPPPCHFWQYDKTITYTNFPSPEAKLQLKNKTNLARLDNTIILDFYYETFDYTVISHVLALTPSSFVSQLGGQISLWIGGSIISVIQLVIYMSSALLASITIKQSNNVRRATN